MNEIELVDNTTAAKPCKAASLRHGAVLFVHITNTSNGFNFMTYKKLIAVIMIAIAGNFEAGAETEPQAFTSAVLPSNVLLADNARLIVGRAADFGTFLYVNLFIDGIPVTTLGFGQGYDSIVRPGQHVLSITTSPVGYQRLIYRPVTITMERGQTYAFTALWEETDLATLKTPDAASHKLIFRTD